MKNIPFERNRYIIAYLVFCVVIMLPLLILKIVDAVLLTAILGIFLILLTLIDPRWGIVVTISSLAVLEILPDIPLVSSFTALLGGATLASFLFHTYIVRKRNINIKTEKGFWVGLALIIWIFVSNPRAALLLGDRVWIVTLIQLWLIAWLSRQLLNDSDSTKLLMISFVVTNLFSAIIVFEQGRVGESIFTSARGYGLALGSNGTARYFVIALLCSYYLYLTSSDAKKMQRLFYAVCALILALGVVYTVSRSGLILVVLAVGLILISPSAREKGSKWGFLFLGITAFLIFVPDNLFGLLESIIPSIIGGGDTAGLRYQLWKSGIKMFQSSPILGIGIGQFQYQLPYFGVGIVPGRFLDLTAHSTYIQLLSEIGIIGLLMFAWIAIIALRNLYKRMLQVNYGQAMIGWFWFATLLIILVGGITKTDFTEKLLWVALGVGFVDNKGKEEIA